MSCLLEADVEGVADVTLSVAVAADARLAAETLTVVLDGRTVPLVELQDDHGTRLHHLTGVGPGRLRVDYAATVTGIAGTPPVSEVDLTRYVRPSRYCEADRLGAPPPASVEALTQPHVPNRRSDPAGSRRIRSPRRVPRIRPGGRTRRW